MQTVPSDFRLTPRCHGVFSRASLGGLSPGRVPDLQVIVSAIAADKHEAGRDFRNSLEDSQIPRHVAFEFIPL